MNESRSSFCLQGQLGARELGDVTTRALKLDQASLRIEDGGVGPFMPAGASVGKLSPDVSG